MLATRPFLRERQFLQLGGQPEAVEQAEDQHGGSGIGLEAQEALEAVHVVEGFVHHRQRDDGVDDVRIGMDPAQHAGQQRDAMAQREEADVQHDVLQLVQEENHANEKHQMVVAGHHVLGAEIEKWPDGGALVDSTKEASRLETLCAPAVAGQNSEITRTARTATSKPRLHRTENFIPQHLRSAYMIAQITPVARKIGAKPS